MSANNLPEDKRQKKCPVFKSLAGRGGKHMRPLGLVSNIFPGTCKLSISKCNHVNFLQNDNPNLLYSGIRGIALVLPADKIQPLSDFKIPINTVNDHELSVDECCDNISHQSCEKEIKEALERERGLEGTVACLRLQCDEHSACLALKDGSILSLTADTEKIKEDYKLTLKGIHASCLSLQTQLADLISQTSVSLSSMETCTKQYQEQICLALCDALQQLSSVTVAKDKAIADGDKKLDILKQRISVAIEGKSMLFELSERHHQLCELAKELANSREECGMLRAQLKAQASQDEISQSELHCQQAELKEKTSLQMSHADDMRL